LSYSVNLHSTRLAKCNGYDDALLLAKPCVRNDSKGLDMDDQAEEYETIKHLLDANVLDGPNFCIGWLQNGNLHFPDWKLNGLLQSTSQVLATKAASDVVGMPVSEGVFTLGNALRADEMFVISSTRGVIRVESVGTVEMPAKSYSGALANAMNEVANSM
jgi:branched-subunit amino acid aminotransferase/4-amino-4-deoxychorismate lyase